MQIEFIFFSFPLIMNCSWILQFHFLLCFHLWSLDWDRCWMLFSREAPLHYPYLPTLLIVFLQKYITHIIICIQPISIFLSLLQGFKKFQFNLESLTLIKNRLFFRESGQKMMNQGSIGDEIIGVQLDSWATAEEKFKFLTEFQKQNLRKIKEDNHFNETIPGTNSEFEDKFKVFGMFLYLLFFNIHNQISSMRENHLYSVSIVLLLCLASSQTDVLCPGEFQMSHPQLPQGLCLRSTADPVYQFCPPTIVWIGQANLCGISPDGVWRNYTYHCQVASTDATGFYERPCSCSTINCGADSFCLGGNCFTRPSCEVNGCPPGFECIDGKCFEIIIPPECTMDSNCQPNFVCVSGSCEPRSCDNIVCQDPFDTCQFGQCYRKFDYFCSPFQPTIQRVYCPLRRPTNQECPTPPFVSGISSLFCALGRDGFMADFTAGCEACKYTFVQYYYNQPCSSVPEDKQECSPGQVCMNGVCEQIDQCMGITCPFGQQCANGVCGDIPNFCDQEADCQGNLVCNFNTNRCEEFMVVDPCKDVICTAIQKCVDGMCVPLCQNVVCPDGYACADGICYLLNPPCVTNANCDVGEVCILGDCKPFLESTCKGVVCPPTQYCLFGKCQPRTTCENVNCESGFQCKDGICYQIDRCRGITCHSSAFCYNGFCYPRTPLIGNQCQSNGDCQGPEACIGSICRVLQCTNDEGCFGNRCVNGLCYNDVNP